MYSKAQYSNKDMMTGTAPYLQVCVLYITTTVQYNILKSAVHKDKKDIKAGTAPYYQLSIHVQ